DEAAQVGIYNEAGAGLPRFKPATLDEVRRRYRGADFDPSTRLYAVEGGRPVAYASFNANGRVSYPWCRKGREHWAEPLFEAVLQALRQRGQARAFAAYRGDWPAQRDFFLRHGFQQRREVVNFVIDFAEMPTPAARTSSAVGPLTPADLPAVLKLGRGVLQVEDTAGLEQSLLRNPYFPPESAFVLRNRIDITPVAV